MREGWLEPLVEDLVSYELAMAELRFLPQRPIREALACAQIPGTVTTLVLHPWVRLLSFRYDPERLLNSLIHDHPIPMDLARGNYHLLIDGKDGGMAVRLLDTRLGEILNAFQLGHPPPLGEADTQSLLKAGLIARWPDGGEIDYPGIL